MSQIGPNYPINHLASSVSGGQQQQPTKDEMRKAAARQDLQISLDELAAKKTEDVDEANLDPDRDADGRTPEQVYEDDEQDPHEAAREEMERLKTPHRSTDLDGMSGQFLDRDA